MIPGLPFKLKPKKGYVQRVAEVDGRHDAWKKRRWSIEEQRIAKGRTILARLTERRRDENT